MLNWRWEDKVGEVDIFNVERTATYNLYQGNAFLIMVYEYEENGRNMYAVHNFFVDESHAKRMLGIDKKDKETYGDNSFNRPDYKMERIRINKSNYKYTKKLVSMLVEAFDEIEIEIVKGD